MRSYHDIVGDGGSDVAGQVAEQQARIDGRLAGARHLLAVGSGKGGVGKSTLAMQLAATFAAAGRSVAVLDADLNGPAQARMAGIADAPLVPGPDGVVPPRTRSGIAVVSLGALVPESEDVDFDSVAPGSSHTWRSTREFSALGELLATVDWGRPELLLVDLPPGPERTRQFAEFLGPRAAFVLVTVPSEVSRGVVARAIRSLGKTPNRLLGYVSNMDGYYCKGCDELRPLFPAAGAVPLEAPCLGRIPFDPRLAELCDAGRPIADEPASPSATALCDLAARLSEALARDEREATS